MQKILLLVTLLAFLFMGCNDKPDADEFTNVVYVDDNVIMVLLGVDYFEAVTAVQTDGGIVVIDAGTSPTLTTKYRELIENEFGRNDFVYLINTHSHYDHTGGNQVFPEAEIIAHESALAQMEEYYSNPAANMIRTKEIYGQILQQLDTLDPASSEKGQLISQTLRYSYLIYDLENSFTPAFPTATFESDTLLMCGKTEIELYYFGNAHSDGDIIIYIPHEKLLFTGDLFFEGGRPSISKYEKEDVERWNRVLNTLLEKDIQTIIQGHGQILDVTDLANFQEIILERSGL